MNVGKLSENEVEFCKSVATWAKKRKRRRKKKPTAYFISSDKAPKRD